MPTSVMSRVNHTSRVSLRLTSMTACLMLGLWLECSATPGLPADSFVELLEVTVSHSATAPFSLKQVFLPPEPLDINILLLLPLELASERPILRQFPMAQMYGAVLLHLPNQQALHYVFYAGDLTDEWSKHALVGARIRYTFERGEVTGGIDALYSQYIGGMDNFTPFLAARTASLLSGDSQIVDLLVRLKQDSRVVQGTHLPGLAASDAAPLGVFIKPTFHLNPQWAVFYRFDYLSLGEGWPKLTEHALGVRFFPTTKIVFRAEFLTSSFSQTSSQTSLGAEGARFSGTIRF
jgi:hypothetical protein